MRYLFLYSLGWISVSFVFRCCFLRRFLLARSVLVMTCADDEDVGFFFWTNFALNETAGASSTTTRSDRRATTTTPAVRAAPASASATEWAWPTEWAWLSGPASTGPCPTTSSTRVCTSPATRWRSADRPTPSRWRLLFEIISSHSTFAFFSFRPQPTPAAMQRLPHAVDESPGSFLRQQTRNSSMHAAAGQCRNRRF